MRPHGEQDHDTAVSSDQNQQEHAAVHADKQGERDELAEGLPKGPVWRYHVDDFEGQKGAEQKVWNGQADVPRGDDRSFHFPATNPNN